MVFNGKALLSAAFAAAAVQVAQAKTQIENVKLAALSTQGWAAVSEPAATEVLQLQVNLKLQNLDRLVSELYTVSDPESERYGQWYDRQAILDLINPPPISQSQVLQWLQTNGVQVLAANGQVVTIQIPVQNANALLDARFVNYEKDGITKIRTLSYAVPDDVAEYIDIITPTTFFGETKAFAPVGLFEDATPTKTEKRQIPASNVTAVRPCSTSITPSCLREFYNIGNYRPDVRSGSRIGFGSFLNQSARYQDTFLYEQEFGIAFQNFTKVFVNDATDDQNPATGDFGEANLDVQNLVGIANPLPITEFLTGGKPPFVPDLDLPNEASNTNEPYLPYYNFLLHQTNAELPQVISNSYGEPEHTVPQKYAERVCYLIAAMGLRGISVLESSGDTGIGSGCRSNDGSHRPQFNPQFPSTCPFITAIGGTESAYPEIAWRDSSGGFSYYFQQPRYQARAVGAFLSNFLPAQTYNYFRPYFNPQGRAFPDISAHSLLPNFVIFGGGKKYPRGNGGTSAAAPVVAGIVGLLNDARLRNGKPSMGFLNPWLYGYGSQFTRDVTLGASRGCSGTNFQTGKTLPGAGIIPGAAWNATTGWDPVTGLGIPDFQAMMRSALRII